MIVIVNEREKIIYQQGFMSGSNAAQAAIKAAERRAEIAERALLYAVSEYRCDECPCSDCNAEIRGSQECIDCICAEYKKEAEKDIAEEREE